MTRRYILLTGLLMVALFGAQSCGKIFNCSNKATKALDAGIKYNDDASATNCAAYKQALQNWLDDESCSGSDPETKSEFEAQVATIQC